MLEEKFWQMNDFNQDMQHNQAHFDGTVKVFFEEVEDDSWIFGPEVPSPVECHQLHHWDKAPSCLSQLWSLPDPGIRHFFLLFFSPITKLERQIWKSWKGLEILHPLSSIILDFTESHQKHDCITLDFSRKSLNGSFCFQPCDRWPTSRPWGWSMWLVSVE